MNVNAAVMEMALRTNKKTVTTTVVVPIDGIIKKQAVEVRKVIRAGRKRLFDLCPARPASNAPMICSIGTTAVIAVDIVTVNLKPSLR